MDSQINDRIQKLISFRSPTEVLSSILVLFLISLVIILGFNIMSFAFQTDKSWIQLASDMIVFSVIIVVLYYYFIEDSSSTVFQTTVDYINEYIQNPLSILYTGTFIAGLYLYLFLAGMTGDAKPISIQLIDGGAWVILILSAFVYFFHGVLKIDLIEEVKAFYNAYFPEEKEDTKKGGDEKPVDKREVFNISNNLYTYEEARTVCVAMDGRLATYDEVEDAYNKGAEWCNYGWSEGQMALFPTQKKTWSDLQKIDGKQHSCGRPGVNGGHVENKMLRFGVNCFGIKPKPKEDDIQRMESKKVSITPKTEADTLNDQKIKFWKEHADKILLLNSFNHDKWSEY
jgi:hypothetical protein